MTSPEVALPGAARLGENPLWDDESGTLLWLDIQLGEVHRFDPESGNDTVTLRLPGEVGVAVLTDGGDLLLGHDDALVRLAEGSEVGDAEPVVEAPVAGVRFNDGCCDPSGRLLVGTLARDGGRTAALYALRAGRLESVVGGLALSNGVDFSRDGRRLYLADTRGERILAMAYDDATGDVGEPEVFVDLGNVPGRPDGLTVDAEDRIWVAMAQGRQVRCFTPQGGLDRVIDIPAHAATSVTFGGPELSDLYVTTGTFAAGAEDLARLPGTGSLWRVRGIGAGAPARRYSGK